MAGNSGHRHGGTPLTRSPKIGIRARPVLATCLAAAALAVSPQPAAHAETGTAHAPWFEIHTDGYFGDGSSSASGQAGATLFVPLVGDGSGLFFGQMDGAFLFGDETGSGSATFGYRHLFDAYILGVNAGLDTGGSAGGNSFGQVTLGTEALGARFGASANIYLPVSGAKTASGTAEILLTDDSISMVGGREVPLAGIDWQGSAMLFSSADERRQLWAYAGGYFFDTAGDTVADSYLGPTFGVEYRIAEPFGIAGSRLTLGLDGRWDEPRGARIAAGIGFRVALGGRSPESAPADPLAPRLHEAVRRSHAVTLGQSAAETVLDADTAVTLAQVAYSSDLAAGDLGAAVAAAAQNSLLIVDEDYAAAQTIAAGSNLTVASTGATLTLQGAGSGARVNYTLPGARSSIAATGSDGDLTALTLGGPGNTIGENLHIAGLDVSATHSSLDTTDETTGLYVNDLTSPVLLDDLSISASATMGSGASDAHVHAVYALENYSGSDDTPFVVFTGSTLEASLTGAFNGSSAAGTNSEVRVYGIRSHDSQLSVTDSTLYAFVDADLVGGSGTMSNTAVGLYGVRGSGAFNTTSISGSTLTARFAGSLAGNTTPTPPSKSSALLYGVFATDASTLIDDSALAVIFDGAIDAQSSAELYALEYEGPGGSTQTLTFTDNAVSVTGSDSANWASYDINSVGARFDAVGGAGTSTVLFAGNDFSGVYDTLVSLNTGYVLDGDSTGNTTDAATATTACYDAGTAWTGSLELGGVVFTSASCSD